jgi:uncharacterized membrane protein YbhN (UPF0104 family)
MIMTFLAAAMIGLFLVLILNPSLLEPLSALARRIFPSGNRTERILAAIMTYRKNPGPLLEALGLSLVANISLVAITALGVFALNPASWSPKMCVLMPIGHVVNSLPLTPGGLGVGETAFNALFEVAGLREGAEALLCWRIWKAAVSLLGLAIYLRGFKLRIADISVDA